MTPDKLNPVHLAELTASKLDFGQSAMPICGVVLFIFALGLMIYQTSKGKSIKSALVLLPMAMLMIGFSYIKSAEVLGVKFEEKTVSDYAANPNDGTARTNYLAVITQLEADHEAHPNKALTPQVRTNLTQAVASLNRKANLSAESRMALSRTELLLGDTNAARLNLHAAITENTNVLKTLNPRLKFLLPAAHP